MNAVKTIIIANQREFTSEIDPFYHPEEFETVCQEDFDHEPVCLFWEGDEKLVITSTQLSEEFVSDACQIMNYRATRSISPETRTNSLCTDIQNDPRVFADLVETIRASDCPEILAWGASPAYYQLIDRLKGLGLSFMARRVPPKEAAWMLADHGSKAGFRIFCNELAKTYPQIKIPDGLICATLEEAFEKAHYFATRNRPFLMKTNQGQAGWGMIVFNPASTLNQPSESQIEETHSGIWKSGPVIVEEYINAGIWSSSDEDCFPLIPTVDLLIAPSGEVQFQFSGNMIIEGLTHFHGVAIGEGALPPGMQEKLQEIGMIIGTALSERGYRGWFDIDLVANEHHELYGNEINTRSTGPIHAHDIYTRLKAQHPGINAVLSNDSWVIDAFDGYSYSEIKSSLQNVLFPINGEPRGLIFTLVVAHGKIGFAIVGQDFADVMRIKRQAEALTIEAGKKNREGLLV